MRSHFLPQTENCGLSLKGQPRRTMAFQGRRNVWFGRLRRPWKAIVHDLDSLQTTASRKLSALVVMAILLIAAIARADEPKPPVRELYVPFENLNVILDAGGRRVFLTREEYDDLRRRARKTDEAAAPHAFALTTAEYDVTVEEERAIISGNIFFDVTRDGLHAIPLPLSGVGLRKATLDGEPAAIGRPRMGAPSALFASGVGQHELALEMVAPLEVAAPRQILRFQLPHAATGRMRLTVPGDVELISGATVLRQEFDESLTATKFELLPTRGMTTLVMSLNNREAQDQQVVVARNVFVTELTETYERLHMTASMQVLQGAVEQFRFEIPTGFEVIDVATPLLSRWEVSGEQDQRILTVTMREAVNSGTVVLNIAAQRTAPELQQWQLSRVRPLGVAGSVSIVGVLVENRLQTQSLEADDLIGIDIDVLTETLPATIFQAEPGAPPIQPVAAYYAPHSEFQIVGGFTKPQGRVRVVSNTLLIVSDSGLEVRGGFALLPIAERIFGCHFSVPVGWRVTEVTYGDGQPLEFQRYEEADGSGRINVTLPQSVPPGEGYSVYFHANQSPAGWLGAWQTQQVTFPQFTVNEATSDRGAIAVQAGDDLVVRAQSTTGLVPLDANRKAGFDLQQVPTSLALQFDARPFAAVLDVERISPRLTAETYSFLTVAPGRLNAHYELIYDVQEARTRELSFRLPLDTPAEISVRGLDETVVKEFNSVEEDDSRLWVVQLAQPTRGAVRLEVTLVQPLDLGSETLDAAPSDSTDGDESTAGTSAVPLPTIVAENVDYQTGTIAIEGSAELEVSLETAARKVDAGELVDAAYQPGRRLLGVYGFVGDIPAIVANVARPRQHALPSAIVQRAELVTAVSESGISQSTARFNLRTKASFIEVELPDASTLWSVYLDGTASKPQRDGKRLLVSLPVANAAQLRDLQIVYETPVANMRLWSQLEVIAPQLFLRDAAQTPSVSLPTADLAWYLYLPSGYRLAATNGTVFPNMQDAATKQQIAAIESPAIRVAGAVVTSRTRPLYDWFVPNLAVRRSAAVNVKNMTAHSTDEMRGRLSSDADSEEFGLVTQNMSRPSEPRGARGYADVDGDMAEMPADEPVPAAAVPQAAAAPEGEEELGQQIEQSGAVAGKRPTRGTVAAGTNWALEGLRSLKIDLSTSGEPLVFQSLGADARLDVKLVDGRRLELLAAGIALIVGLFGLRLIPRTWRTKLTYVAAVLVLASVIPLITGLDRELGTTFDWSFGVGLLLLPVYVLWHFGGWLSTFFAQPVSTNVASASLFFLIAISLMSNVAHAAPPETQLGPLHIKLLDSLPPVSVPENAIIVPYNPDSNDATSAERVIIPYQAYEELWQRAFPDRHLKTTPPPAPYALAGAAWETRLDDLEHLQVTGKLLVEIYADEVVTVLLPFDGGVLTQAEVNGQPARVQLLAPDAQPHQGEPRQRTQAAQIQQPAQKGAIARPVPNMLAVYLDGTGRKQLSLTVRYPLTRRGGWRIAQGYLPAAQATALQAIVPTANTEVRLRNIDDRTNYETTEPNEIIETALGTQGQFHIQWRPQISQTDVDTTLTVDSAAVVDVQEDSLRVMWQLQLRFPRGERDAFELQVPADYLVENVAGDNIRSWKNEAGRLEVRLIKAARDIQQISVHLAKPSGIQIGGTTNLDVPVLEVGGAMLHEGHLAVRRSPLIELRTIETRSVVRTDVSSVQLASDEAVASPLGIRPYQAYQFDQTPFLIRLGATPLATRMTAEVQSVLRIGQSERTLESRVTLQARDKPIHMLQFELPAELSVEHVTAPEPFHWSVRNDVNPPRLNVFCGTGQTGSFSIIIRGQLGDRSVVTAVALPRIHVDGVTRQDTVVVVQTDPSYNAVAEQLIGCETILLRETHGWLSQQQRQLARVAVRSQEADFGGQIVLARRTPRVSCLTISNVHVTNRAFEETVLLDYTIRDAGIRSISFLLPSDLRDARASAPLLRSKSVEDVEGNPALVRVRLELQDEVIGQFRVLIENDRMLSGDLREVPIPIVESARVEHQFVALESAGRDEVVVDSREQLEPLSRQQEKWRALAAILGDSITQAFLVETGADAPRLVVKMQDRQTVETVGARIAFAQTTLTVDASGAYRGSQQYQVDNRTEQFLVVALPADAQLWTARVAGEVVKPIVGQVGQVRIPLVKTAEGEQDYAVELKYGGCITDWGIWETVNFPFIQTVKINVESSQVRLYVPDTYRWFAFGGSMRRVDADEDFIASYLRYKTEQLIDFSASLASENPYAQVRARANLKQLTSEVEQLQAQARRYRGVSKELTESLSANSAALQRANRELQLQAEQQRDAPAVNNRRQLNIFFSNQDNDVARNLVTEQSDNFDVTLSRSGDDKSGERQGQVQSQWIDAYSLRNESLERKDLEQDGKARIQLKSEKRDGAEVLGGKLNRYSLQVMPKGSVQQPEDVAKSIDQIQRSERQRRDEGAAKVERFEQRLAEQNKPSSSTEVDDLFESHPRPVTDFVDGVADDRKARHSEGFGIRSGGLGQERPGPANEAAGVGIGGGGLGGGGYGGRAFGEPTGFASLDVDLPQRGIEYRFTTPRGNIEINARRLDNSLWIRIKRLALVAGLILLVAFCVRIIRSVGYERLSGPKPAVLLLVIGFCMLLLGVAPALGGIALVVGIILIMHWYFAQETGTNSVTV